MKQLAILWIALGLFGCTPPQASTSTPTATVSPQAQAEPWTVTYGSSGGVSGGGDSLEIWSDGSVFKRSWSEPGEPGLRHRVGQIPTDSLLAFGAAMSTPEMAALKVNRPDNMTTSLTWTRGTHTLNYAWPMGADDLPEPLKSALADLEAAQSQMVAVADDLGVTVGGRTLKTTYSLFSIPAVAGDADWGLTAVEGETKLQLSVIVPGSSLAETVGRPLACSGQWQGKKLAPGELTISEVHNGLLKGTFKAGDLEGSFKTDVVTRAFP